MPDTYHSILGKFEWELRNRLNNNNITVSLCESEIKIIIYEFVYNSYEYNLSKYYVNWKEAYDCKALCDKVVLMHTFGVTE